MPFSSLPSPPTLFPTYLVPSLPFRRRKSSTDSNTSTSSTSSNPTTPQNEPYLSPTPLSHLRCSRCLADLALSTQIISKGFTGRHGRAYLVSPSLSDLPNTNVHKPVPRQLVTGAHTVGDISCSHCGSVLGWKYIAAEQEEQRYKVGKYILETKRVVRCSTYDGGEGEGQQVAPSGGLNARDDEIEFDSQDEDECDALFSGQWTPQVARELRRAKKRDFRGGKERE